MSLKYVAKTGSDSTGDGSFGNPWLTITYALAHISASDTLFILPGSYLENIYNPPNGSSDVAHTIIKSYILNQAIIAPSSGSQGALIGVQHDHFNITFDGLVVDGINAGAIDGITICDNSHSGDTCYNVTIQNCIIRNGLGGGSGGGGITARTNNNTHPSNIQILNNIVVDWGKRSGTSLDHGIYAALMNSIVEGNIVHGSASHGIHQYSGHLGCNNNIYRKNQCYGNGDVGIGIYSGTGTKVYNNIIDENDGFAGLRLAYSGNGTEAYNNTVYKNNGKGILIESSAHGAIVRNNITRSNVGGDLIDLSTDTTKDHNKTEDPLFMDAVNRDYRLRAGSPCINAGVTVATVTTDIAGNARPQGGSYDIGAYEFISGTTVTTRNSLSPFSSSSIWNQPIPSAGPVYTDAVLDATTDGINWYDEPIGIIDIALTDPLKSIFTKATDNYCVPAEVTTTLAYQTNLPNSFLVTTKKGKNGLYCFVDTIARRIRESYLFQRCTAGGSGAGRYFPAYQSTTAESSYELDGDGIPLRGMVVGSLMAGMGGVIRQGELTSSSPIGHALAIIAPSSILYYDTVNYGFKWPARSANSFAATDYLGTDSEMVLGALLSLDPSFNINSLTTAPARKIATALRDFGGYIVDSYQGATKAWGLAMEVHGTTDDLQVVKAELLSTYGIHLNDYAASPPYTNSATTDFKADLDLIFEAAHQIINTSPTNPKGDPTVPIISPTPVVTPTPPVTPPSVPTAWVPPTPAPGDFTAPGTSTTAPGIPLGAQPPSLVDPGVPATFGTPRIIKVPVRSFTVSGVPGSTVFVRAKWRRTTNPLEESAYSNILAIPFNKIRAEDVDLEDLDSAAIVGTPDPPQITAVFGLTDFIEVSLLRSGEEGVIAAYIPFGGEFPNTDAIWIQNTSGDPTIAISEVWLQVAGGLNNLAGFVRQGDTHLSGSIVPEFTVVAHNWDHTPIQKTSDDQTDWDYFMDFEVPYGEVSYIKWPKEAGSSTLVCPQDSHDPAMNINPQYFCMPLYARVRIIFNGLNFRGANTGTEHPYIKLAVYTRTSTVFNLGTGQTVYYQNMPVSLQVGINGVFLYSPDFQRTALVYTLFSTGAQVSLNADSIYIHDAGGGGGGIDYKAPDTQIFDLDDYFLFACKTGFEATFDKIAPLTSLWYDFLHSLPEGIQLVHLSRSKKFIFADFNGRPLEPDVTYYFRVGARRFTSLKQSDPFYVYSPSLGNIATGQLGMNVIPTEGDTGGTSWKNAVSEINDLPATGNSEDDVRLVEVDNNGFPTLYTFINGAWRKVIASIKALVGGGTNAIDILKPDPGIGFRLVDTALFIGLKDVYEGKSYAAAYAADLTVSQLVPVYRVDRDCTVQRVYSHLITAPSGSAAIFDIKKNGSSLWTLDANRPQIAASATSGTITAFNTKTLVEGDILTFHIIQKGSTVAGNGLTIQLDVQAAVRLVAPTTPPDP